MKKILNVVVLFAAFFVINVSIAGQEEALVWLASNQDASDGSISQERDIATVLQSSHESARALLDSQSGLYEALVVSVIDLLGENGIEASPTELLSRRVILKSFNSLDTEPETTELLQRINEPNSVGFLNDFDTNLLEKIWALQGLAAAGISNADIALLINLLTNSQNVDGSFQGVETDDANIYVTAQATIALQGYRTVYNVDSPLNKAAAFLKTFKQSSGHWGNAYYNALALLALVPSATELSEFQVAIDYLKNNQLANGSWQDDVYITALAARTLSLVDNFIPPAPVTTGTVLGNVVNNSNGQPLEGVSITAVLTGQTDVQIVSNATGGFEFSDLENGDYQLTFSLSGFVPRTIQKTVEAGQTMNIGNVSLAPAIGVISGSVSSYESGEPIANASITVTGATTANVVSDASGDYYIVAELGTSSIEISAAGFQSVTGVGTIDVGTILDFSPQLFTENTTPPNIDSDVFGVVIDQTTGMPIENALITIVGQALSVQTNPQGEFTLLQLSDGAVQLSVSKTGYATNNYDLVIPSATNVDVGTLSLYPQQDTERSIIFGEVFDVDTDLPIDNAIITLSSGEQTSSDAQGSFTLDSLTQGSYQLTVSKEGYLDSVYNVDLPQGTLLQAGRVYLKERDTLPTSAVYGIVSDRESGLSLAGVEVSVQGQTAITDTDGSYEIQGIDMLTFQVFARLTGYLSDVSNISLEEHTDTQLNIELQQASINGLVIEDIQTDQLEYPAYTPVMLTTNLRNDSDVTQRVNILFQIESSNGDSVFSSSFGDVVGSQIGSEILTIAPDGSELIPTQWFTGIESPGIYTAIIRVFDDLTNQLLAERESIFTIIETRALSALELDATPLFANVGEDAQVTFSLRALNRSNVAYDLEVEYQWSDPQGVQLRSATQMTSFSPEQTSITIELDSFPYTFPVSGEYPTALNIVAGPIPSQVTEPAITIAPSVRIEPSQDINPKKVLPDGDKRIKLNIRIQGVEQ